MRDRRRRSQMNCNPGTKGILNKKSTLFSMEWPQSVRPAPSRGWSRSDLVMVAVRLQPTARKKAGGGVASRRLISSGQILIQRPRKSKRFQSSRRDAETHACRFRGLKPHGYHHSVATRLGTVVTLACSHSAKNIKEPKYEIKIISTDENVGCPK